MKYIYIDESGDLGNSYSSSKYFVIGAIIVDNPYDLKKIIKKARRKYRNLMHKSPEIKGNKTDKLVMGFVIKSIIS
ncbi:DUF3800 domain-containing protein [Methanobrevibacter sp.]